MLYFGEELALGDRGLERVVRRRCSADPSARRSDRRRCGRARGRSSRARRARCSRPPRTDRRRRRPACSFGAKEYGVRHFGQNPSVRPGLPSRDRPTGAPHVEQKRLSSATDGSASTTERGSATGAAGTFVMPAPRCWDPVRRGHQPARRAAQTGGERNRSACSRASSRCSTTRGSTAPAVRVPAVPRLMLVPIAGTAATRAPGRDGPRPGVPQTLQ